MPYRYGRTLLIALVAVVSLSIIGCSTPPREVAQFGAATESMASSASGAFTIIERWGTSRNVYDLAADPTAQILDTSLDDNRFQDSFALRIKLLRELELYGKSLKTLASTDTSSSIDEAAVDLGSSLSGLSQTIGKLNGSTEIIGENELAIVTTSVSAIGRSVAESKRNAAVKKIILASNEAVQTACTLVRNEFGTESEFFDYTRSSIQNAQGSAQQALNFMAANRDLGGGDNSDEIHVSLLDDFETRRQLLKEILALKEAGANIEPFFKSVDSGTIAVGSAHQKLFDHYDKGNQSMADISTSINDLIKFATQTREFYEKVKSAE